MNFSSHPFLEIPRVINVIMTQNEAPDPPNEDPTYERYQSSEQRGKKYKFSIFFVSNELRRI